MRVGREKQRQQETGEDVESLDSSFTSLLMNDGAEWGQEEVTLADVASCALTRHTDFLFFKFFFLI